MDYGFIWLLPLALLVIPAAVCYVLFSKINALGDSLDIITEELSALQKMIRDSRKEYRKPAEPAKKAIGEEREQTAENTPAEMRQETAKTSGEEAPVPHAPAAYWWEQSEPIRPSVVEIPVKEKDERKQETIGQETESAGQKEDTTEQAADRQDRKPFPAADRPVRSSEEHYHYHCPDYAGFLQDGEVDTPLSGLLPHQLAETENFDYDRLVSSLEDWQHEKTA